MMRLSSAAAVVGLCFATCSVQAGVLWNETVNGDLSGDRFNPTVVALMDGSNTLSATSIGGDREYVTMTVPTGKALDHITLLSFQSLTNFSFIGVQAGTTVTVDPTAPVPGPLLGYAHFSAALVGTDILDDIGGGAGSMTFSPPLFPGTYTFWIQETSTANPSIYSMDFHLVPAPSAATALFLPALFAIRRRR